ncbi:hypothetical protein HQ535_14145 [bacterium]|nr:hypothetical protein [bacterium]
MARLLLEVQPPDQAEPDQEDVPSVATDEAWPVALHAEDSCHRRALDVPVQLVSTALSAETPISRENIEENQSLLESTDQLTE